MIPEERLENVLVSMNKYLADNYNLTAIQWPNIDFDSNPLLEWIKPDLLIGEGPYYRQVGGNNLGKDLILIFNINIFGRREYIKLNSYRLIQIRDVIRDLFREPMHIPVADWVTGGPTPPVIGVARCMDFSELGRAGFGGVGGVVDVAADVFQYNISIQLRYLEQWIDPTS